MFSDCVWTIPWLPEELFFFLFSGGGREIFIGALMYVSTSDIHPSVITLIIKDTEKHGKIYCQYFPKNLHNSSFIGEFPCSLHPVCDVTVGWSGPFSVGVDQKGQRWSTFYKIKSLKGWWPVGPKWGLFLLSCIYAVIGSVTEDLLGVCDPRVSHIKL